jgi:hypothetical protein
MMALPHISVLFVWPPCSPGLNPLDFYSLGQLKSLVYSSPVDGVETLRNQIMVGFQTICNMPGIWDRLQVAMRRTEACIQAGGRQMEHLLLGNVKSCVTDRP